MTQETVPAGTPLATRPVQAGDTNKVVRWGDHSLLASSAPSPGVQAVMPKAPARPSGLQGLFKSFGL